MYCTRVSRVLRNFGRFSTARPMERACGIGRWFNLNRTLEASGA
jgi:hypothetical protein